MMVPIGIVTRNRVAYLDVTLRSLSATNLPDGVALRVFDDGSSERSAKDYYSTNKEINIERRWPTHGTWKKTLGLGIINEHDKHPRGIKGEVKVVSLGGKAQGVVNASCQAYKRLLTEFPDAPGAILLQDDVLFKEEWYERLTTTAANPELFGEKKLGLLAGIHINKGFKGLGDNPPPVRGSGITAQCVYLSREAFTKLDSSFFGKRHAATSKFDDSLRRVVSRKGFWAGVIMPFVCQHFGVVSLVRPRRNWHRGSKGRVGFYVQPPYTLADEVRCFEE